MIRLGLNLALVLVPYLVDELLEGLSSDVLNELARRGDQLFFYADRLGHSRYQLRDIHVGFDILELVKGFAQRRLKHIARVGRALILQEVHWKQPTAVKVCIPEVPVKVR